MVKLNEILKNKSVLFLSGIIITEITLLFLFTILFITTNIEAYEILSVLVSNLTILTSGIIALTIPFVMKNIEKREKQEEKQLKKNKQEEELRERIKTVINELKKYFEIIISSKFEGLPKGALYISPQFQFFKSIAKNEPEFLIKLGIDIENFTSTTRGGTLVEGTSLIILNIYRLRGGNYPTLSFISTDVEFSEIPYSYEYLLKEIIENVEKNYSITLDKDLCLLSPELKSGYQAIHDR